MTGRIRVGSLMVLLIALGPNSAGAETLSSCLNACYPNPTEDCFKLQGHDTDHTVSDGFKWLFAKFSQAPQKVEKTELQSQFGVEKDSCNRSDTVINSASITNSGPDKCIIATTVDAAGLQISAGIVIPTKLEAAWSETADGSVALSLEQVEFEDRPYLGISNEHLQEAWGGIISAAQFKETTSILVTTNGCLRYDY